MTTDRGDPEIWDKPYFSSGDRVLIITVAVALAIVFAIAFFMLFVYCCLKKLGIVRSSREKIESLQRYEVADEEVKIELKSDD